MAVVSFTATTWVDDTTPAITAAQLNRIEDAIEDIADGTWSDPAAISATIDVDGVTVDAGTAGSPSIAFQTDPDTGLYRSAANTIAITAGGTARLTVSSTLMTMGVDITRGTSDYSPRITNGNSASTPGYSFYNDLDTGMYRYGANQLGFAGSGTLILRLDPSTGLYSVLVYNVTTGSAANVNVASGGLMARSTSAAKYKTNIETADWLADIDLRPVEFDSLTDPGRHQVGFIADEVAEALPVAADLNDDGEVENYDFRAVLAVLAAKIRRLEGAVS